MADTGAAGPPIVNGVAAVVQGVVVVTVIECAPANKPWTENGFVA